MDNQKLDDVNSALITFLSSMPSGVHAQLLRTVVDYEKHEYATFISLAETARGVECAHKLIVKGSRHVMDEGRELRLSNLLQQIGLSQPTEIHKQAQDHRALITIEFPGDGIDEQELEQLVGSKHVMHKSFVKGVSMVKVAQVDTMTTPLAKYLSSITEAPAQCA